MKPRVLVLIGIAVAGYAVFRLTQSQIGRGVASFHMGGIAYLAYLWIVRSGALDKLRKACAGAAAGLWLFTVLNIAEPADSMGWSWWPDLSGWTMAFPVFVLFPLTILTLAIVETRRGSLGRRVAWIGDLSYSSYLIHFPVQVMFALAIALIGLDHSIYASPWLLGTFVTLVVALSFASHRFLEVPAQRYLRNRLLRRSGD